MNKVGRPSTPWKHKCTGALPSGTVCGSTNLRFLADGNNYRCTACGHRGNKKDDLEKKK
jgi:tRNA(Ile2) C34 agmatinyltransferase TiaS